MVRVRFRVRFITCQILLLNVIPNELVILNR